MFYDRDKKKFEQYKNPTPGTNERKTCNISWKHFTYLLEYVK